MSKPAFLFLMLVAPALAICLALLGLETLPGNLLGWFLLLLGIAYPAGGVIYYFIRREPFWRSAAGGAVLQEQGDRSFWAILPGFLAAFFAPPLEWLYLPALLPRTLGLQVAGLALVLLALVLRLWARSHLRGLYAGHVEIQVGHHLVQTGPYRFIRHPGYTGFLLLALGLALGYASWLGLLAVLLLLPGLAYRMHIEETLLSTRFGQDYAAYVRRTKKLIPGLW